MKSTAQKSQTIILKTEEQVINDLNKNPPVARSEISKPAIVAKKLVPVSK